MNINWRQNKIEVFEYDIQLRYRDCDETWGEMTRLNRGIPADYHLTKSN